MLVGAPAIATAAIVGDGSSSAAQPSGTQTDTGMNEGRQPTTGPSASSQSRADQQLSENMVQSVQQKLQEDGYYKNGRIDGVMGPQTYRALQQFQQAKGRESNGQLDQQTLAALGVNAEGDNGQGSANGG
jgi:peptidoglycan hydrolase-like protein with peptidoglycan-binding domain